MNAALFPTNTLEMIAWRDCLLYTASRDDCIAAFRRETDNSFNLANTPLDKLIDEATGADVAFVEEFIGWFNENVWGPFGSMDDLRAHRPTAES